MGGTPTAAVVTLGLPRGFDPERVRALYRGLNRLAAQYQVAVVGGETTTNPGGWLVNVALLGTVPRGRARLRSGAKVGEALFVTGDLGGSLAGKHLDFEPRLAEGRWLLEFAGVSSVMDLSDGLASDLPKLLAASGVPGAELRKSAVPVSRAAREHARTSDLAKPPFVAAVTDGEDFELLFTVQSNRAVAVLDEWKEQFPGVRLSCIGKLTEKAGVWVRGDDGLRPLPTRGYEHFA
jgi:thiamine-monophosphate kinase